MNQKLDTLQSQPILRTLISLKLSYGLQHARQDVRFSNLDERAKSIAESILENKNFFTSGIQGLQSTLLDKIDEESNLSQGDTRKPSQH